MQGRGPCLNFLPYVSNPELEGCVVTWDFFETIHSRAYTHIMKNVYSNPAEVFDTILHDDEILKRAQSELQSQQYTEFFQPVPRIDEFNIPQGLAGNSAYVIKPAGAIKMIELAQEHGMWPNDALMCYQLIESLGVTRNFYTRVQGLRSTTTL